MSVRTILLLGNPVLRTRCKRVARASDAGVQRTIRDLFDTLENFRKSNGFGRGIAAPQIGVTARILVINIDKRIAMINPRITDRSKSMMTLWDDCFSFPDILARVKRHKRITVEYTDADGTLQEITATGGMSELLQHEIDHLDGILAIDRAITPKDIVLRSEYEKLKRTGKSVQ